ncbi:MAG: hypothetical protein HKN66_10840 [Flavobacteriaceae bacterium]|nr:hypothetical protein [Flavobacteriaceae bacterium]
MKRILLTFSVLFLSIVSAQDRLSISGIIINAETGTPIEFVNIGFNSIKIGTVSKHDGSFTLELRKNLFESNDHLIISSIGYQTEFIPRAEWSAWTNIQNKILLNPETTQLDPVIITAGPRGFERLGSESYSLSELGFWNDDDALGGELATRIKIEKKRTKLIDFKFHVLKNEADSVKVRINIYNCDKNMPGQNILSENIFHTITTNKGIERVSLKEYNITTDYDIVVGIEMVKFYGDELYLSVSATPFGGTAYLRERSQSGWDVRWNFGLAFGLLSSYPQSGTKP